MKSIIFAGLALLCGACVSSTSSIDISRAEEPIRQFCPAFKSGSFSPDSSRTYGSEQVSTFQNGSPFNCRCLVKAQDQTPSCQQVRRLLVLPPEP
jgi:hypothetical protein